MGISPSQVLTSVALWASLAQASNAIDLSIIDLQKQRSDTILDIVPGKDTSKAGFARLVNLNPQINTWFILDVTWPGESKSHRFHIENPDPENSIVYLDNSFTKGLKILVGTKHHNCELWADAKTSELIESEKSRRTFAPICDGKLYVRYETEGSETTKEFVVDFLRSNVWGGDQITTIVKDYLYKDKFLLTASADDANVATNGPVPKLKPRTSKFPKAANIDPAKKNNLLAGKELGLSLQEAKDNMLIPGQWYETKFRPGVFVSAVQANTLNPTIFDTYKDRVQKLDGTEASALSYMVAFDLEQYDLGFALGTKHPSPEWSERAPDKIRRSNIPGPDGIGSFAPLKMTGKVNPEEASRTVATFTGGFKRTHGAFKWGKLSLANYGSHYGFMENGVVFSKLQPDLATLVIYRDGSVDMKTWTDSDEAALSKVKHARQNGVPIIDYDAEKKESMPGSFVSNWMAGNWSGSVDSKQRALRAGACLQEDGNKKFLIYGYFSSVTPNAMARIFQGYHCKYALHLDMNALEHTYLAVYQKDKKAFNIEHLITGMNVLDKKSKEQTPDGKTREQVVPRFVGTADNRDFFYVMEKR